jgi:hypothetical protein
LNQIGTADKQNPSTIKQGNGEKNRKIISDARKCEIFYSLEIASFADPLKERASEMK